MAGKKAASDLAKGAMDFAPSLGIGAFAGFIAGKICIKLGKTGALGVGSGIIIYEIAYKQGFVKEDLDSIKGKAKKSWENFGNSKASEDIKNKAKMYAAKNKAMTSGFVGGFFMGLALG